jgi:hypothetical protein
MEQRARADGEAQAASGEPDHTTAPRPSMATSSARLTAKPKFCSTSSMVSPSALSSASLSWICWTTIGASPSVGSSSSSSSGFISSARAMASICCSPPESWPPPVPSRPASAGNSASTRSMVQAAPGRAKRRAASSRFSRTVSDGKMSRVSGT